MWLQRVIEGKSGGRGGGQREMVKTLDFILSEMGSHQREQRSGGSCVVLPISPFNEYLLSGSAAGWLVMIPSGTASATEGCLAWGSTLHGTDHNQDWLMREYKGLATLAQLETTLKGPSSFKGQHMVGQDCHWTCITSWLLSTPDPSIPFYKCWSPKHSLKKSCMLNTTSVTSRDTQSVISDMVLCLCCKRIFLAAVRRGGKMEAGRFVRRLLHWPRWKTTVTWARIAVEGERRHSQVLDTYESQAKRIYS